MNINVEPITWGKCCGWVGFANARLTFGKEEPAGGLPWRTDGGCGFEFFLTSLSGHVETLL